MPQASFRLQHVLALELPPVIVWRQPGPESSLAATAVVTAKARTPRVVKTSKPRCRIFEMYFLRIIIGQRTLNPLCR